MTDKTSVHDRAIDALLELLAEREWSAIALPDIAARGGLGLADLRGAYPSKGAILGGYARRVDQEVLRSIGEDHDLEGQPARERLFDVMMRRFEALRPHKAAVRSASRGLLADPMAATAWNKVEVNSAQWMLAAAGIEESGPAAAVHAQGLALIFARVFATWLDDNDPDMTTTMRELDIQLRRAERIVETGDVVAKAVRPFRSLVEGLMKRRGPRPRTEEDDAAAAI